MRHPYVALEWETGSVEQVGLASQPENDLPFNDSHVFMGAIPQGDDTDEWKDWLPRAMTRG
ncbi:hypothetical protein E4U41_005695 [Claviceps citrina]|nr:hypothetical protein E4U41_005695 [Claviceps citrina]